MEAKIETLAACPGARWVSTYEIQKEICPNPARWRKQLNMHEGEDHGGVDTAMEGCQSASPFWSRYATAEHLW